MTVTYISLTIGCTCPECGAEFTEDFLAFSEVKCSECDEIFSWADILTDEEHNVLDAAQEILNPILEEIEKSATSPKSAYRNSP